MTDFEAIKSIKDFETLVKYLRTDLGWPIDEAEIENSYFTYTPSELGLDEKSAVNIEEIKQIKPLVVGQPWGIFWIEFESKRLPVTVMRRILAALIKKKRGSSKVDQAAWEMQDLMFISATGEDNDRGISFAHFRQVGDDLPQLRTFYWDTNERHFYYIKNMNLAALHWPSDEADEESWQRQWAGAFTSKHHEVITKSKDLAARMAELASATRDLVIDVYENEVEKGPLHKLFNSFKELLIHDLEIADFADMYAQTITYGLFSAAAARSEDDFNLDYAVDLIPNTNPFLRDLLEECLRVGSQGHLDIEIDELGVGELVTVLGNTDMEAVIQDFGRLTGGEDPVIHFYETFLDEYDAEKKAQRGVFFTPWPVVSYIVRSVDELLRIEFGLEDGLADTTTWGEMAKRYEDLEIPEGIPPDHVFVQILDPATGTGTFLVEVIDIIHKTMVEKWEAQDHGEDKIEAMWNEYVPEHLLPRLHGYEIMMSPYAIAHLKIGLKLTETGYRYGSEERVRVYLTNSLEPASDVSQMELKGILPALAHEAQAVNEIKRDQRFTVVIGNPPYSKSSANRGPEPESLVADYKAYVRIEKNIQPLSDDYLKFMGLSRRLLIDSGVGLNGMITNRGYLVGLIHRGVRQIITEDFNVIRVCDLHGDSNVGETPPGDLKNENVFDIQQGVAIGLFAKLPAKSSEVSFSELWGTRSEKYDALLKSELDWSTVTLHPPFYMFHIQERTPEVYKRFISLEEFFELDNSGVKTHRDKLVVDFDRESLVRKIRTYVSSDTSDGFEKTRRSLRRERWSGRIIPILYRPFDYRWIFYEPRLIDRPRLDVAKQMSSGRNIGLISVRQVPSTDFCHVFVSRHIIEMKTGSHDRGAKLSPLFRDEHINSLDSAAPAYHRQAEQSSNLSAQIVSSIRERVSRAIIPEEVLSYIYTILHSPTYRSTYLSQLRLDYPRVPLPTSAPQFDKFCELGRVLIALHLMESPKLDDLVTTYSGPKNPEVGRVGWSDGTVWLDASKTNAREGHRATEPGTIGFQGIPEEVWDFHIGGYQVCHKWLKDRKGRTLSKEDINHYQKIIVALNETIHIMGEIDEVIDEHGGWPDAFAMREEAKVVSEDKVISFPQPGDAEEAQERPLRKAAERGVDYEVRNEE